MNSEGERRDAAQDADLESWDLFCRVIDNYGDIGVAWRLARQLASDARRSVRLWIDDLAAFTRIEPRIDRDAQRQHIDAIEVSRWSPYGSAGIEPADAVIELFGCGLPQAYVDAMAHEVEQAGHQPPVWIDLEYLSAEAWVDDFHRLPSPHRTLPLVKYFFYPGFGEESGGLPIEAGLEDRRRAFIEDGEQVEAFWRRLRVHLPIAGEMRVSLFVYSSAPFEPLFQAMSEDRDRRWSVVVPEGVLSAETGTGLDIEERGSLSIITIPFVDQDDFDRLLWSCDINFVRGEDSFVRAQWAARPFVWHIYPQADDAHMKKLDAFEERYEAGLPQAARDAQQALWHAWNTQGPDFTYAWARWCDQLPELSAHAQVWRQSLASQPGLVDSLAAFVAERRGALLK